MSIELIGLAFDSKQTDQAWNDLSIEKIYDLILEDEFRSRMDLRSMLYHKGLLDLLSELDLLLKQGGFRKTLIEILADRFKAGVEDFPTPSGELLFDYKLIRHFTSLAMVDNFVLADTGLRALLHRVRFLKDTSGWSLLETRDYRGIAKALQELKLRDIFEVREQLQAEGKKIELENLVRTYIEFLNYSQNNGLTSFFYNTQSDIRRWGNLIERKNIRGEQVVELTYIKNQKRTPTTRVQKVNKKRETFEQKARHHREFETLFSGLKDIDPLIRQKSAESVSKLMEGDAIPRIQEFLKDPEPEVRKELVRALASIEDPTSEQMLLEIAKNDENLEVQVLAAFYLRKRKSKQVLPILFEKIGKGIPHFGVVLMGHPLLQTDKKAQSTLIELAASNVARVRKDVAFLLGHTPSTSAKRVLKTLTKDPDDHVKMNALYSLAALKEPSVAQIAKEFEKSASSGLQKAGAVVRNGF